MSLHTAVRAPGFHLGKLFYKAQDLPKHLENATTVSNHFIHENFHGKFVFMVCRLKILRLSFCMLLLPMCITNRIWVDRIITRIMLGIALLFKSVWLDQTKYFWIEIMPFVNCLGIQFVINLCYPLITEWKATLKTKYRTHFWRLIYWMFA